ncbi:MAG: hypothetical protein LBO79_04235 [Zoogloeaceae bacterium]|jgi:hypothetical protein|nr:hypothetical protein [Zoogloeaceae bacterium]
MFSSHRSHPGRTAISRIRIASTAARLMAQDGITDPALAKKKAARQLNLPGNTPMPDNAEVEAELRLYHALYQHEAQPAHLAALREEALRVMELLGPFRPYLTGPVLEGTAGLFSPIDLMLFADSAKEVEIFLLNRNLPFEHLDPRHEQAEVILKLSTPTAEANLVIFPPRFERHRFHYRDGRFRERATPERLKKLLEQPCP